jgi:hypothetical protein
MPFSLRSALRLLAVWAAIPAIAICQVAQPSHPLDSHAQKIQEALASLPSGSYILVTLRDNSRHPGKLVDLSDTSFDMISLDQPLKVSYAVVKRVQRADNALGVVSRKQHVRVRTVVIVCVTIGFVLLAGAAGSFRD